MLVGNIRAHICYILLIFRLKKEGERQKLVSVALA